MAIQNASGTTLAISTTLPTTFDDNVTTGYPSSVPTYNVIGQVTSIPAFGSVNNTVLHNPLGEIDVAKRPGSRNHGSLNVPMALDAADAGQTAALGAIRSEVAVRVSFPDGAAHYFTGYLMGMPTEPGGSDSMVSASLMIEATRAEVRVAAP